MPEKNRAVSWRVDKQSRDSNAETNVGVSFLRFAVCHCQLVGPCVLGLGTMSFQDSSPLARVVASSRRLASCRCTRLELRSVGDS